jgi:ATP-dependent DNA helicase RecG
MTREELIQLVADVHEHQCELDNVEVKSAHKGPPTRIFEVLSAFANRTDGGVLVFGLDENRGFEPVGVGDAQRLQEVVSQVATNEMEPALRPDFTVELIDGKTIVAVEISGVSADQRPCYYKPQGLQKGSYIRVGNTNRQMTDYEIFGYVSARTQPTFEEEAVANASLDDLDQKRIEDYIATLKSTRPNAIYLNQTFEALVKQLGIARDVNGTLCPTLAGLLVFGKYPQAFEPQLVITFLQYYGTTEAEMTPRGERFLDNRKFEGSIPEMLEQTVNHVLASIRKSSLIEGLYRRNIPEYPEAVLRESIVNAVAHRDYSNYVRGSYIQIRLFADRLEIQSPGGLYGSVTEETLEEEQSTRNRVLMRLLEDLHLVENRGSGIRAMIAAMRSANLEPPRFQDKRSSFWVIFRNHTLMSPAAVTWLNQFAGEPLNDHQRLALVYLRNNPYMTNNDYRRINHVDSVAANRELRALAQARLIKQHSTRRWAHYTLNVPTEPETVPMALTEEERILSFIREHGSIKRSKCEELLSVPEARVKYVLRKMLENKLVRMEGKKKGAKYVLP